MNLEQTTETGAAMAMKAAPPVTVVGAKLLGLPVAEWVQWFTLVYLAVMLGHKLWSWHREWKRARDE